MAGREGAAELAREQHSHRRWWLLVAALLLLQAAWLIAVAQPAATPFTADEYHYLAGGQAILKTGGWPSPETYKHGPVTYYSHQLASMLGLAEVAGTDYLAWSRGGTILLTLLASGLLVILGYLAQGPLLACMALWFWCCNPMVLGHGALVTADMALTLGHLLVVLLTWRYLQRPSLLRLLGLGLGLGVALATKYTALLLLPALALAVVTVTVLGFRPGLWLSRNREGRSRALLDLIPATLLVATAAWLGLHACYLFGAGLFDPSTQALQPEGTLARVVATVPGFAWLLRLLPAPFVAGIDFQLSAGNNYLTLCLDQVCTGHWAYYLLGFLTKLPLGMLLALALAVWLRRPRWPTSLVTVLAFVGLVPLVYLSLFAALQLGLRYQLPLLALLCLVAARPMALLWRQGAGRRGVAGLLLLATLLSTLLAWPHYVGYFHELARTRPYLLFGDSNLDWDGNKLGSPDEVELRRRHPGIERATWDSGPRFGKVLVRGLDLWPRHQPTPGPVRHWLRQLTPVDRQGAWFVFDVRRRDMEGLSKTDSDPRTRRDLAVALLGAGAKNDARTIVDSLPGQLAAPLRDLLAADDEATVMDAWARLGRHDLVLENPKADPSRRAAAHYARMEWSRCRKILNAIETNRRLRDPEAVQLILSSFHLGDVEAALAAVERYQPDRNHPSWKMFQQFREQLVAFRKHLQQIGR